MVQSKMKKFVGTYLGGEKVEITLAEDPGIFEGRSTAINTQLAGENFDNCMMSQLVEEFKCKHRRN
ncbi:hypothetical protein Celaphus_00009579 [Cervus elaphus hippelaphus]|uniref:Uncharacterized protein n=1 Tax=Cervus elaphus hippelaphus TaxID=46360 RepID=A0A212C0U1_CEREH|nr:hypothetical protein Celaphus_00009579 [Cervus elaphus hippelaphus]